MTYQLIGLTSNAANRRQAYGSLSMTKLHSFQTTLGSAGGG